MTTPSAPTARQSSDAVPRSRVSAPELRGPGPLDLLVGSVVGSIFLYEVTFNITPDSIRLPMAAVLSGGIALLSIAWVFANPKIWRVVLFGLLMIITGCWLMGEASGEGTLDFNRGIRFLLPFYFALWIVELRRHLNPNLILYLAGATLIIAALASFLRPQEVINNVMRLPPFTGGEEGAHASAYVTAICALLIHQLWIGNKVSQRVALSFLAVAGVILIGLRVATPIFMLLNYGLLHTLLTRQLKVSTKILLWIAMAGSIVMVLIWHEALQDEARGVEVDNVENLGSGRIGTWLGRIDLLAERDVGTLLFGSGPGSDRFYSEIWWWEKKDSHHDLLTTTIESGFLGLFCVFLFLFLLFRRLGREGAPLFWFMISGSFVSNALMQRPIIATLFWLSVALAASRVDEQLRQSWIEWRQQQQWLRQQRRQAASRPPRSRRTGHRPGAA